MAGIDIIIWFIALFTFCLTLLIFSIYFLTLIIKEKELKTVKRYYTSLTVFFLTLGICGFIDFYYVYLIIYLQEPDPTGGAYFFLINTFLMLSFFSLTYTIEKHIKQSEHFLLSKTMFICFLVSLLPYIFVSMLSLAVTDQLALIIYLTFLPFTLIILYLGIFYLKLGKNGEGIIKKKAYSVAFGLGFVCIGISVNIMIRNVEPIILTTGYLFPIGFIILGILGIPLLFIGFKR